MVLLLYIGNTVGKHGMVSFYSCGSDNVGKRFIGGNRTLERVSATGKLSSSFGDHLTNMPWICKCISTDEYYSGSSLPFTHFLNVIMILGTDTQIRTDISTLHKNNRLVHTATYGDFITYFESHLSEFYATMC